MALIGKLATSVAIGAAIFGCLALGLVASERSIPDLRANGDGLNFDVLAGSDVAGLNSAVPLQRYSARDGADLGFRRWESGREDLPLIVAVHGSGWHGQQFSTLGAALARQGLGDVIAPDLRGHGHNPERRGDVDYIGQFEDDLADLIAQQVRPGQRVVMLGHSSGGGLVIRFAGGAHGDLLSGAVLLAPFVQHDAPTMRTGSGGWARVMTRRIIGLSMLNMVGITGLNHLPILQFRFPSTVLDGPLGDTATRAYSFRLNASYAPRRDWQSDIAALPDFLLLVGDHDEAFVADAFEPAFSDITQRGRYGQISSGHLDLVDHPETLRLIGDYMAGL